MPPILSKCLMFLVVRVKSLAFAIAAMNMSRVSSGFPLLSSWTQISTAVSAASSLKSKTSIIEILSALNEAPKVRRLEKYCPNESTKSTRLKELRKRGFITVIIKEIGSQSFIHYQITEKGKKALELVEQLEKL